MILTGIRGTISCAHAPVNVETYGGETHGHSYEIVAWWCNDDQTDVREYQRELRHLLVDLDHKTLPPDLSTGEAIAHFIAMKLGCHSVEVRRPVEGIFAKWIDE